MSLIDIVKAQGQHRGLPPWKLRSLLQDAELRAELAELTSDELLKQLDAAGIEISGLLYDLEQERAARQAAEEEGVRLQAELDNATSTSFPAGHRDVPADDQPTHPAGINVLPLWDALGIVPGNTSPSHVPGF